ncbi:hypothetical protein AVEN_264088-1 [Araneus ventricosus]|uniref:Uncharacterized protein n=1 Tax=Araneus ventricosus TaxID=182803 RepID=A0A4Y2QQV0_ARAVE|nr:hypothetical protein AVEN_199406-1 [Araneus ventricosus]GBN66196.1 hypothetical protein AVEN_264088-1 [Araneus ventricosus]
MTRTIPEVAPPSSIFHITPAGGHLAPTDLTCTRPTTTRPKENHPALPKHPGKQLKDRPPQQIVRCCIRCCGSCIIAPITNGSCSNSPFHRGTTSHRKWATLPLLCHRVDESCLLIRKPLLRELTVSPRWGRPTTTAVLRRNWVSNFEHSGHEVKTLPPGRRGLQQVS